jgi:type IV pilus assembly protein PilY1
VDPSDGTIIDVPDESTYWSPNYIHWFMKRLATTGQFPSGLPLENRKMAAKRVLKDIINEVNPTQPDGTVEQRVRFGLARMHTTTPADSFASSNGGFVVEPIATNNKAALLATLRSSKILAPGLARTPLSESLIDVARYFAGNFLNPLNRNGFGQYPVYNRNTTDGGATGTPPPSPIDANAPCRENFVIVVTDGEPTDDGNNHYGGAFSSTFGADYDGDGNSNNSEDYNDTLDDVAAYLFQEDLVNDSVMPDQQNIITYTIGFALDVPLLQDTAENGDGEYYTATNGQALADNLRISLEDIVLRAGSFTAAAVPASRSAFGDGFYTTYFEPQGRGTLYRGHLQSYRLTDDFDIVGTDGQSAVDPNTGEFLEPRTTFFWDAALHAGGARRPQRLHDREHQRGESRDHRSGSTDVREPAGEPDHDHRAAGRRVRELRARHRPLRRGRGQQRHGAPPHGARRHLPLEPPRRGTTAAAVLR